MTNIYISQLNVSLKSVQRTLKALYVNDSVWKIMYVRKNKFETGKSIMNSIYVRHKVVKLEIPQA